MNTNETHAPENGELRTMSGQVFRHVCHQCRSRSGVNPILALPRVTDWCAICGRRAEGTTVAVEKGKWGNLIVSKDQPAPAPSERPTPRTDALSEKIHAVRLAAGNNQFTIALCGTLAEICETIPALERELAEAREERDRLKALVGTIRSFLPIPARNVGDVTPEKHSHEIGNAITTIAEQRDSLAQSLKSIASGKYTWRQCVDEIAPSALATVKGGSE